MASELNISGVDKSDILQINSLRVHRNADRQNTLSCSFITKAGTYMPKVGEDIQAELNSDIQFGGIIKTVGSQRTDRVVDNTATLLVNVTSNGYRDIPYRRTITGVFDSSVYVNAGDIVAYLQTTYLADEGIGIGAIQDGADVADYIAVSVMTIGDLLDRLAEMSGYKWYINQAKDLYFIQDDTIFTDPHSIDSTDLDFTDYEIMTAEDDLTEYANKIFVKGGLADDGYPYAYSLEDSTEIAARALIEGGTGVYGYTIDNSEIVDDDTALAAATAELKKRGRVPSRVTFSSFTSFEPTTKVYVKLPAFGLTGAYYYIDSVDITQVGKSELKYIVSCVYRDQTDMSGHQLPGAVEFFSSVGSTRSESTKESAAIYDLITVHSKVNDSAISVSSTESFDFLYRISLRSRCKLTIHFTAKVTAIAADQIYAKVYVGATELSMQPVQTITDAGYWMFTFQVLSPFVAAGIVDVKVGLWSTTGVSIATNQGELTIIGTNAFGTATDYMPKINLSLTVPDMPSDPVADADVVYVDPETIDVDLTVPDMPTTAESTLLE